MGWSHWQLLQTHERDLWCCRALCVCTYKWRLSWWSVKSLQKFDYKPPHTALLTVWRYFSHFNTSVTCMALYVAPQSVSFSSALHALPCDIGITTLEMRNTWSSTVNPLGDDSGRTSVAKMCSKCAGVGKSDRKSLPEPRVMFSLKSVCLASFLSLPPLFLFLAPLSAIQ